MPKNIESFPGYDYGMKNAGILYGRLNKDELLELSAIHFSLFYETGQKQHLGRAVCLIDLSIDAERRAVVA